MKRTAVIYQSKYGSTEQYAKWISEELKVDLYKKSEVSISALKNYEVIVYGGGIYLNGILGFSFIKNNYKYIEAKKIIVFAVGASPQDTGTISDIKEKNFPIAMKYIPCFYFRGAFCKDEVNLIDKISVSAMDRFIYNKKDDNYEEWQRAFVSSLEIGGDWKSKSQINSILEYIRELN